MTSQYHQLRQAERSRRNAARAEREADLVVYVTEQTTPGAETAAPTEMLTVHVPSQTDPAIEYTLHAYGDEITCNCPGWSDPRRKGRRHCKHTDGLRAVLQEERDMTTEPTTTAIAKRDVDAPPAPILAERPPTALLPARGDLEAMALIAGQAVKAVGMIPASIKTKEQALAVMLAGWELGLRPMTALRHIYVVNGRTEIETRAMVGIIKARRPAVQFSWPEYTREAVTCIIQVPGQRHEVNVRYTVEDAKASGQMAKPGPWQLYTRDMLYAAATKRACRLACPDLINAIEGSMHTEAEALSLEMAPAEIRTLDEAPADIVAEAYNAGDEGALAPEVEPPPTLDHRARIGALVAEAKAAWDEPSFVAWGRALGTRFPRLIAESGKLAVSQLEGDEAREIADALEIDVHGVGPAVEP